MQNVITLRPRGEMTLAWWVAATAMSALTVSTVGGNVAVLTALRRIQRAPAHYPLASLATADLLVGLFVLPIAAARELFVFHLNWAICSCWSTLDVLCCTASILSICALGWERWCGITSPLARAKRSRQARLYAALIWPISTTVALPTVFIPSPKHALPGEIAKACTVNTNVGYVFVSMSLSFYLPASVMVFLYTRILRALSSPAPIRAHRGGSPCVNVEKEAASDKTLCQRPTTQPEGIPTPPEEPMLNTPRRSPLKIPGSSTFTDAILAPLRNSRAQAGIAPRQRRATRTIVMLMFLFLLCWTPFFVMLPTDSLCECVCDAIWLCCTWLGYANSALNPLVYAASSPTVSKALHASLTSSSCTRTSDVELAPRPRRS